MTQNILFIFDLDDTLIFYGRKHKISVPRQTFHKLRAVKNKGYKIAVVSYSPLCEMILCQTRLSPYVDKVASGDFPRPYLIKQVLKDAIYDYVHYYDNRLDNLLCVKKIYPNIRIELVFLP